MAHHLYTTDAFVLRSIETGEANRTLDLFTKELGLVRVVGRSLRQGKSKLRFGLQPLSFAHVTLVRGKDVWRLTGSLPELSLTSLLRHEKKKLYLSARAGSLLARLVQGEEKNEALYDTVSEGLRFLARESFEEGELQNMECALVLQILYHLGYVGGDDFNSFLLSPLSKDIITSLTPIRSSAIVAINRSLKETHL